MVFAAIYIPDFSVQAAIRVEPPLRDSAVALVDGTPPVGALRPKPPNLDRDQIRSHVCSMAPASMREFCVLASRP